MSDFNVSDLSIKLDEKVNRLALRLYAEDLDGHEATKLLALLHPVDVGPSWPMTGQEVYASLAQIGNEYVNAVIAERDRLLLKDRGESNRKESKC